MFVFELICQNSIMKMKFVYSRVVLEPLALYRQNFTRRYKYATDLESLDERGKIPCSRASCE